MTRVSRKAGYFGKQRLQTVQNLDVLRLKGLFLLGTPLRISKQGIGSSVSLALTIVDLEVVTKELLGPTDLSGA